MGFVVHLEAKTTMTKEVSATRSATAEIRNPILALLIG